MSNYVMNGSIEFKLHMGQTITKEDFDKMTAHTCDFSHELAVPILLCCNNK